MGVNIALGGTLDNFDPAIEYFKKLKKNDPWSQANLLRRSSPARSRSCSTTISTPTGRKHKDEANVEFVIPAEGPSWPPMP